MPRPTAQTAIWSGYGVRSRCSWAARPGSSSSAASRAQEAVSHDGARLDRQQGEVGLADRFEDVPRLVQPAHLRVHQPERGADGGQLGRRRDDPGHRLLGLAEAPLLVAELEELDSEIQQRVRLSGVSALLLGGRNQAVGLG